MRLKSGGFFDAFSMGLDLVCLDPLNREGFCGRWGWFGDVRSTFSFIFGEFICMFVCMFSQFLNELLSLAFEALSKAPVAEENNDTGDDARAGYLLVASESSLIFDRFFVIRSSIDCVGFLYLFVLQTRVILCLCFI